MMYKDLLISYLQAVNDKDYEKGVKIYENPSKKIVLTNEDENDLTLFVPSERNSFDKYCVSISNIDNFLFIECDCPAFDKKEVCKHCVAAALFITNKPAKDNVKSVAPLILEQKKIIFPFKSLAIGDIDNMSNINFRLNNYWSDSRSSFVKIEGTTLNFEFKVSVKTKYHQTINFVLPSNLEVECDCGKLRSNSLCLHTYAALCNFGRAHGEFYFNKFKDFSSEKNELLRSYGITLDDKEAEDFKFGFNHLGNLILYEAPSYIIKDTFQLSAKAKSLKESQGPEVISRTSLSKDNFVDFELGFLFHFGVKPINFLLKPITITDKKGQLSFGRIKQDKKEEIAYLQQMPEEQFAHFERLLDNNTKYFLASKGQSNILYSRDWMSQLNSTGIEIYQENYYETLKKIWPYLVEKGNVYKLINPNSFANKNIFPVTLGLGQPVPVFKIFADQKFITIQMNFSLGEKICQVTKNDDSHQFFVINEGVYYLLNQYAYVKLLQQFVDGILKFPLAHKIDVITRIIAPLKEKYFVDIPPDFNVETRKIAPVAQVMVAEYLSQFLMLIPQFIYDDNIVEYEDQKDLVVESADGFGIIERDKNFEKDFYENLRPFHSNFAKQLQNPFFYLPFSEVMQGNWFLKTIRKLQDQNVTVKGMQDLKKFRYNTNRPSFEIKTSSGTDWFDMKVNITFGQQVVPLRDLQKAIRSGQKIVVLGDGTFGVLPEDWLRQYAMVMKMGEVDGESLRVNKMHFTILDELHSLIDEEAILAELEEKKLQLQNIDNLESKPVSKKIKAILRPYQKSGFQWLQALEQLNWGGCLADDMGLGKTLQTIAFLQFIKEKYKNVTSLVVCPTSLIYNWESELQKFAPTIKYHIYYGSDRSFSEEHLEKYDIIITSYGTMRIDIEELQKHSFHYVILDESQSIKNPEAQVSRAAQLLKAKNRLILSGTPVQNNTFDLYAQMNFLNPGFLGNKEFFKSEFATPIDKNGSSEVAEQLRKMIYPFMLRRTKEKVATDLPDKTESILWCEMKKEQRAVYEDYKNYYRHQLMNRIEEEGMNNSAIYILEGLLRLRQICNSPVLVKDPKVITTSSIKLQELLREVTENSGNHKILIFSQFTEMLALVQETFKAGGVSHLYLDGKTPSSKRKGLVDQFQNDPGIKAFLISLKAGGVGLNLTAADYVYLIDPWWNPAVEDQAIDRTHRIGQTNKVFAYKMICKDTVEEKILQLQLKKKSLSKELISEEKGFIKKLSKDDVEFLFS